MVPSGQSFEDAIACVKQGAKTDSCSLLVYTLVNTGLVESLVGDSGEMQLCVLHHEANIPVGIGFSLPACDYLRQEGKYGNLRRSIFELESLRIFRESLKNDGIELGRI